MFKISVEVAKIFWLIVKQYGIDLRDADTLHRSCIDEVKRINGAIEYPFIKDDIVENQYHDLNKFLNDVDLVIIMVKHDEIKQNMNLLADKVVFDTQNICDLPGVYKL